MIRLFVLLTGGLLSLCLDYGQAKQERMRSPASTPAIRADRQVLRQLQALSAAGHFPLTGGYSDTLTVGLSAGWNLVSLPLAVPDNRVHAVIPEASSEAFGYDQSYTISDSLHYGAGYWIKSGSEGAINIVGSRLGDISVPATAGWNLIGAPADTFPADNILSVPPNIVSSKPFAFAHQGGTYQVVDTLLPGHAYWLKTNGPGVLSFAQWTLLGFEEETISALALNPDSPHVIYAGSQSNFSAGKVGALFKTTNAGTNWDTLIMGGTFSTIKIDPMHPEVVYAVPGTILKSTDAGASWSEADDSIRIDGETRVRPLAIEPVNPLVLYAGTVGFFGGSLYKSTDGGMSWNDLAGDNDTLRNGIYSIAIDPTDPGMVYASNEYLWKSTDGGANWRNLGILPIGSTDLLTVTVDHNIYAGVRFNGLFRSSDGGQSWAQENIPDTVQGFFDMATVPIDPTVHYLATSMGCFSNQYWGDYWNDISNGLISLRVLCLALSPDGFLYAGVQTVSDHNGGLYLRKIHR